jgi:hypothetical protein
MIVTYKRTLLLFATGSFYINLDCVVYRWPTVYALGF